MPRVGLTRDRVVAEGAAYLDEVGLARMTVSALAERLGVAQPSLYKHIDNLPALMRSISIRGQRELTQALAEAAVGRARGNALTAVCRCYRQWATAHPGLYATCQRAPTPGDTEAEEAAGGLGRVGLAVLGGYDLTGEDAVDALRALRAALHGFVTLEGLGGFGLPVDVDRSFDRMVAAVIGSIARWNDQPVDGPAIARRG